MDSSIAWLVGKTRTLTCCSLSSRIPAIRHAPRRTRERFRRGLPASGSNTMGPQPVREGSTKDFYRQIAALHSAERTFCGDPGVRDRHHRGRNVFAAFLAFDCEVASLSCGQVEHWDIIGEHKTNLSTILDCGAGRAPAAKGKKTPEPSHEAPARRLSYKRWVLLKVEGGKVGDVESVDVAGEQH